MTDVHGSSEIGTATDQVDEGRRKALVQMGQFAGLTAPVVVTLLTVDAPAAWAGSKPGKPPKPRKPPKRKGGIIADLLDLDD
jgi:hypothetical protein